MGQQILHPCATETAIGVEYADRKAGSPGENLPDLVHKFKSGVKLIKGDPVYPIRGLCDAVVGRLDMAKSEVEANIAAVIKAACAHRNPAPGPFMNRALLMTIPGEEYYALDINAWLPVPSAEELEKLEKRRNSAVLLVV
ncbi:unnamed protein product [Cylicocyclus nassatus]|uniref:Uncharacterized protein n=1 Tax=Cylicocyclus nassatus TaxID=53992 RepID=A0AA36GWG1_CYLNA|nr:unnamed protein product [Cylicocyclus nassatus]